VTSDEKGKDKTQGTPAFDVKQLLNWCRGRQASSSAYPVLETLRLSGETGLSLLRSPSAPRFYAGAIICLSPVLWRCLAFEQQSSCAPIADRLRTSGIVTNPTLIPLAATYQLGEVIDVLVMARAQRVATMRDDRRHP